jgi:Tol biopolymer transport system component
MIYHTDTGEISAYSLSGTLLFSRKIGSDFPSIFTTSVTRDSVYFMRPRVAATNQEPAVLRSGADGITEVKIPAQYTAALSVSPDEQWIAWSTLNFEIGSELWIAKGDGSDARKVASYGVDQSGVFFLRPFEWTPEGKLLFERALTGIGGYILYGGHNSLYSYDPNTGEILTIVPAEENHGLCLDTYRSDLGKVVFNCAKDDPSIRIRDLATQTEIKAPVLPGQTVAGSAKFSPSGKWLAYGIAAREPENERGQIVVVPADLSAAPQPLINIAENSYGVVHGWLDDDTIVFSRTQWPNNTIWSIKRDGSAPTQIGSGIWAGWLP